MMDEPNWEGKDLDYACTLISFAEQVGIQLWQAMALMKYAKSNYAFSSQAKIKELETALDTAHKIFGSESDKLSIIIKELEDKLTSSQVTKVSELPGFPEEKKWTSTKYAVSDGLESKSYNQARKEIGDLPIVRPQVNVDKIQGFPKEKDEYVIADSTTKTIYKSFENKGYMKGYNQAIQACKLAYFKKLDKEKIKDVVFFPPYYPTEETWDEWSTKATQAFIDYMKGGI